VKQGDAETCGVGRHACSAQRLKSRAQHMMVPRRPGPTPKHGSRAANPVAPYPARILFAPASEWASTFSFRIWTATAHQLVAFLHYTVRVYVAVYYQRDCVPSTHYIPDEHYA
jgi:hypothetical protein